MAIIHLAFDVDSEVHPELHAMLSSIGSGLSRGERMRQLAAAGLVWETFRIQGLPPSPLLQSLTERVDSVTPLVGRSASRPVEMRPPRADPSDFVDLAIDAAPVAAHEIGEPSALPGGELHPPERPLRELPILVDVVDPTESPLWIGALPDQRLPPVRPSGEVVDIRQGVPDSVATVDESTALPQRSATRTRLQRMKEKGLFKNG